MFVYICVHGTVYLCVHGYIVCAHVWVSWLYVGKVRVSGKFPWSEEEGRRALWEPASEGIQEVWKVLLIPGGPEEGSAGRGWSLTPQSQSSAFLQPQTLPGLRLPQILCAAPHTHRSPCTEHLFNTHTFCCGHVQQHWMGRSCLGTDWMPVTQ